MSQIGKPVRRIESWPIKLPRPLRKKNDMPDQRREVPAEPERPEPEKVPAGKPQ